MDILNNLPVTQIPSEGAGKLLEKKPAPPQY